MGHTISPRDIKVDGAKVQMIKKLPPTSVKEIRSSFGGHTDFYRQFIKGFSKIAKPLCTLLEKDLPYHFLEKCLVAFNTLKEKFITVLILSIPDWNLPFELMCDASDFVIGAVLGQPKNKYYMLFTILAKLLVKLG